MSDVYVTLSGNVTADPRQYQFPDGSRATSLRLAVNRRVLDRQSQTWTTEDTTYYLVRCYRALADNVAQSVRKGHPLVVYGRLRIRQFEDRQGERRFSAEVEASSVGHDLKWGIASFEKPIRSYAGAPGADQRRGMEDATREWELRAVSYAEGRPAHPVEAPSSSGDESTRPSEAVERDAEVARRADQAAEEVAEVVGQSDKVMERGAELAPPSGEATRQGVATGRREATGQGAGQGAAMGQGAGQGVAMEHGEATGQAGEAVRRAARTPRRGDERPLSGDEGKDRDDLAPWPVETVPEKLAA
ncbi:single-stranded DNA-binding protein [Microtetraspora niveoalba]|uniref:single-stranded DNA-binding protein n=1 Tax=Microtetraspora niveoalba TaxID=46175 RepID=UPI00082AB1A5|nr:single-stranded DNA-binding protein [Microtetraspora niveoalba]